MPQVERSRFEFAYGGRKLPFCIWRRSGEEQVTAIVFLGTVQIGHLPRWAAEHCPPGTLIVEGAPHWHAAKDGSDILEYMEAYTLCAYRAAEATWRVGNARMVADSQAVPGLLRLLVEHSQLIPDAVVLLQPLGLNSASFGTNRQQRIWEFRERVWRNLRFQYRHLLTDSHLRYNHGLLMTRVNVLSTRAKYQYSSGLAYDSRNDLAQVAARMKHVSIICGADDQLFPAEEIRRNLHESHIDVSVKVLPGIPHSPLPTRLGLQLLDAALE
jgi:hypothetical protein